MRQLRRIVPLALLLLASVLCVAGLAGQWSGHHLTAEVLASLQTFARLHGLISIAVFCAFYALSVALSLPVGTVLTVAGGFLFGPLAGALSAIVAKTVGSLPLYFMVRHAFPDLVARHAASRLAAIKTSVREDGFYYLLSLRLQPVVPFWIVNVAAALFEVPLRRLVLATVLGIAPAAFVYALAGAGLDGLLAADAGILARCLQQGACAELLPSGTMAPRVLLMLAALAMLSLLPVAAKRRFRHRRQTPR